MKRIYLLAGFLALLMLQACYKDPVANFEYSYVDHLAPAEVKFTNLSAEADKYLWDFGDGQTSNAKDPVHIFYDWENLSVTLTAKGRGGDHSINKTVEITSYYVTNSSDYNLYNVSTYYWDGEEVSDLFNLGNLAPGYETVETVITTHDEIWLAFEAYDGTLYVVGYYNLPNPGSYYFSLSNSDIENSYKSSMSELKERGLDFTRKEAVKVE